MLKAFTTKSTVQGGGVQAPSAKLKGENMESRKRVANPIFENTIDLHFKPSETLVECERCGSMLTPEEVRWSEGRAFCVGCYDA